QNKRGAEVRIGLDSLLFRDLVGPARRHDLPQQRQRALDLEPLVQFLRLAQQVGGLRLGADRRRRCHDQRQAQGETLHGSRSPAGRGIRPSATVLPAVTTSVVSSDLYPAARTPTRRAPPTTGGAKQPPTPAR